MTRHAFGVLALSIQRRVRSDFGPGEWPFFIEKPMENASVLHGSRGVGALRREETVPVKWGASEGVGTTREVVRVLRLLGWTMATGGDPGSKSRTR
jgi:hypothetical protein